MSVRCLRRPQSGPSSPYAPLVLDETVAVLGALGTLATAVAVFVALLELRAAKDHTRTAFEDDIYVASPVTSFLASCRLPTARETMTARVLCVSFRGAAV